MEKQNFTQNQKIEKNTFRKTLTQQVTKGGGGLMAATEEPEVVVTAAWRMIVEMAMVAVDPRSWVSIGSRKIYRP
jgi:hypothetical protein